ncbi:Sodium channel subunit beta-2 [Tupaia chinensis]|uniref:Junctional adhesion molecule-like n=1 Tax=Tupaia chinensis TaxID=246437 RepID=M0QSJ7_TUPCH|nr:Sodium channel subunit beta-2 [Tupaia chinensis]
MCCLLKLFLMPVLLDYSLGLNDLRVSSPELTVHVGDSALMGCVFQSTEEKRVIKVDWMLSPGEPAQDEYVLYYYSNLSVPNGRFKSRASLVGDIVRDADGSLLLQDVQQADQGTYTCEIRLEGESLVFKKTVVLYVLPEEPKELMVHVGGSALMGCAFQSTEEKRVTRIDWMFSSGERAKEEIMLYYHSKFNLPVGYPQSWGRFQNRVNLVGDISRNDGSVKLEGVKESDGGVYTCSIHLGSLVFRKTVALRVILEEPRAWTTSGMLLAILSLRYSAVLNMIFYSDDIDNLHAGSAVQIDPFGDKSGSPILPNRLPSLHAHLDLCDYFSLYGHCLDHHDARHLESLLATPAALRPALLGGNQLVIIVGIVCATILLLPVLILIVKKTHGNKSSAVKSLENAKKANPEKHIYSSIATREGTEGEEPDAKSEATYVTMKHAYSSIATGEGTEREEPSTKTEATYMTMHSIRSVALAVFFVDKRLERITEVENNPDDFSVPPGRSMEVTVPTTLNVLNGSDARLLCTFNSCYTVNHKQFSLNWTYQECSNCSEEMFLQFRMKIINLKLERFRDRVEFSGNPSKYDVSVTLRDVQLEDEGIYNCYIMNPPDRHRGHGKIQLQVLLEEPPERDSTVAVIVGASVGGFLAVVILVLMVVKCVRRKKEQKLSTDDLKTEEEGKTDGEGNAEDGTK